MLYILPIFFGLALSQAHIHTSCESMDFTTTLQSSYTYQSTAIATLGNDTSNTHTWTATLNGWSMMSIIKPSPTTIQSTALGSSSSSTMPALPHGTSVEAVIEIHIGNLSGTATIDLTNSDGTSTSLVLESESMTPLPTSMAHSSHATTIPCFGSIGCKTTDAVPQLANASFNANSTRIASGPRFSPTPTALDVFTGAGTSVHYNNIYLFILLQVTTMYLV
jgi:hypothetical protein